MVYINATPATRRPPANPRPRTLLGLSDLEQKIMTVLWDTPPGTWITPLSQLAKALPGRPAAKTVHQALTRLCAQGHVTRQVYLNDNGQPCYRYRAAMTRDDFLVHHLLAVVTGHAHDPAATLARALDTLTKRHGAPSG